LTTLLRGWRRLRTDLRISVLVSNQRTIDTLERAGLDVDIIPVLVDAPSWKFSWWEASSLNKQLRKLGADVVMRSNHYQFNVPCPQVILHQNLWRFSPESPDPEVGPAGGLVEGLRNWSARKALRSAEANVFISNYLRSHAEAIVPESRPRNHVIYNAIDDSLIEQSMRTHDRYNGSAVIAAVQDGNIQKDNQTLVRTMGELVRREPNVDWRLKVAGGTGTGRFGDDFIQLAKSEGVADRIDWLGFQSQAQIDELLRTSLCLVFTSVVEGFGLPSLEAMVRRCPVVACNATAMPEIVRDAGLLVAPRQASQFADSVVRLYRDRELRSILVDRGLERAMDFPASASAAKFCEVFQTVTGIPVQWSDPVQA
jgi:glycosyltransferase involved in cell wall biosynthesis